MAAKRRDHTLSAAAVAERSGLSRPYIYYLIKRRLLKPVGPSWGRVRFDADAVRVAKILAETLRRGAGPMAIVRAVDNALAEYRTRVAGEGIQPLEEQMDTLTGEVWELLGKAAEAGSVRSVERDLLTITDRYEGLKRKKNREVSRLGNPPPDDPSWRPLDSLFGSRSHREEFVRLFLKMRGVGQSTEDSKEVARKEEDADAGPT